MADIPGSVTDTIQSFLRHVEEDIRVDKVFLFGSYARGNFREGSDIDLAIVSPDFKEEDCIDNMTRLLRKAMRVRADIQTIPFSPEEYNNPKGLMEEIRSTGIELRVA